MGQRYDYILWQVLLQCFLSLEFAVRQFGMTRSVDDLHDKTLQKTVRHGGSDLNLEGT